VTSSARRALTTLALVSVAVVWGGTFVMVKDAVAEYPLYSFLGWRFAIATVAFVMLFPGSFKRLSWGTVRIGLLAGAFLTAGYIFQTWGLQATSASKAAFVTGMFVVITPLMQAVLLRRPPKAWTIVGVVLSVVGLWLLSGGAVGGWNVGDTRVLLCAIAYSAHMIVLGGPGRKYSVSALTLVQLATVALTTGAVALTTEHAALPTEGSLLVALLVTGVLASAVAFAVQTYAQQHISPTKTALILITEPAFGGVFGWLAGESLGVRGIAGSALILGGMVLAEVVGTSAAAAEHVELEASLEGPPVPLFEAPDVGVRSG